MSESPEELDRRELFLLELDLNEADIKIRNPWWTPFGARFRTARAIDAAVSRLVEYPPHRVTNWIFQKSLIVAYKIMPEGYW